MRPPARPSGASTPGISAALPLDRIDAVIFDMDGVVTDTAAVHFRAWKQLFDRFLEQRARVSEDPAAGRPPSTGDPYRPFDGDDYRRFVDGKPRESGVRDFLASRGIVLREGPSGDPEQPTVVGLGLRKNAIFLELVESGGVDAFASTTSLVDRLRAAGRGVAVISASENASHILEVADVRDRFTVKVDGTDSRRLGLPGKPDPAIFLEAARRLGRPPQRTAVVEDALAGVVAGVRGGFGFVIAVDRAGYRSELAAAGASLVVADLGELLAPA
jgi:beta-phosphoglucomutase family hydrolase